MALSAQERAERSAAAMWAGDGASKWFGMSLVSVTEGRAEAALTVEAHHANGLGKCHGGVIFALADTAFAFACNSRNQASVAQQNSITYLAPGEVGDRLTAVAEEVTTAGRSGLYDVTVTNQRDEMIARFTGLSRTVRGQLFDES